LHACTYPALLHASWKWAGSIAVLLRQFLAMPLCMLMRGTTLVPQFSSSTTTTILLQKCCQFIYTVTHNNQQAICKHGTLPLVALTLLFGNAIVPA
jgi:hypothetical protein